MDFIDAYMKYAEPQTAAPKIYHYYMAYSILSQLIGKKATYNGFGGIKGPNLWFVLLGPSSLAYKSTILRIGKGLLRDVYGEDSFSYPNEGSYESFIETLSDQPHGIIMSDEFVSLMNWVDKDYNSGLLSLLTSLYDQPHYYNRKVGTREKSRIYRIDNPYINIFSLSTIEWFTQKLDDKKIMGGFLPRFCLIKSEDKPKLLPRTPPREEDIHLDLVTYLTEFKDRPFGAMTYTSEAESLFDAWYVRYVGRKQMEFSSMMQPFLHRRISDIHKFSMIHCAMRNEDLVMSKEDLERAISIGENILAGTASIINDQMSLTPFQSKRGKILELISKLSENGSGSPHWKVMKNSKMPKKEFRDIIDSLEDENTITIEKGESRGAVNYKLAQNPALITSSSE